MTFFFPSVAGETNQNGLTASEARALEQIDGLGLRTPQAKLRRTKAGVVPAKRLDQKTKYQPVQIIRNAIPSHKNMPKMISDGRVNAVVLLEEIPGVYLRVELFWRPIQSNPMHVLEEEIATEGFRIQPQGVVDTTGGLEIDFYFRVEAGTGPRGIAAARQALTPGFGTLEAMLTINQQMISFFVMSKQDRPNDHRTGLLRVSDVRIGDEVEPELLANYKNTRVTVMKRATIEQRKLDGALYGTKRLRSEEEFQAAWV